jgi:hypothetical protein
VQDLREETPNPPEAKVIKLSGSVGVGGRNNPDDIKAVKQRLHELGYIEVGDPNTNSSDVSLNSL